MVWRSAWTCRAISAMDLWLVHVHSWSQIHSSVWILISTQIFQNFLYTSFDSSLIILLLLPIIIVQQFISGAITSHESLQGCWGWRWGCRWYASRTKTGAVVTFLLRLVCCCTTLDVTLEARRCLLCICLQSVQHNHRVLYKWHSAISTGPTDAVGMLCKGTDHLVGETAVWRQFHSAHGGRNNCMCCHLITSVPSFGQLDTNPKHHLTTVIYVRIWICSGYF